MKRFMISGMLAAALAIQVSAADFGIEFSAGSSQNVGVNVRFSDLYEMKPGIGFRVSENDVVFAFSMDNNFYFISGFDLSHYAGVGVGITAINNDNDDVDVTIDGHYGLRYDINAIVSIFGDLGLAFDIDPLVFRTFRSALGCTFFIGR
jgi:hypothetical protein